jgi:hypothetical protein
MSDPHDLGRLTRWGEGAVIAILVSLAAGAVPLLMFLPGVWGWARYAGPCASALLIFLAWAIELRSRRRGQSLAIPPGVIRAGHEHLSVPDQPPERHAPADAVRRADSSDALQAPSTKPKDALRPQ